MAAWKQLERRVARAMGGTRTGPTGHPVSDITGTRWSVEVKRCKREAVYADWIRQARAQGKQEKKPWLLVVGRHNDRAPICVLPFADFLELAQAAGLIPQQTTDEEAA